MIVHAGLVARPMGGRWRGVLILGASGSGKSDLALRLIDSGGFSLVADDRVLLWTSGGRLFGRAPDTLFGLVEARGLGVLPTPARAFTAIDLAVECVAGPVERLPEPERVSQMCHDLPLVRLVATEASAPAKIGRALMGLG
jgi:serine kinase of HPr protein (carbohydrate metabolism regulator)